MTTAIMQAMLKTADTISQSHVSLKSVDFQLIGAQQNNRGRLLGCGDMAGSGFVTPVPDVMLLRGLRRTGFPTESAAFEVVMLPGKRDDVGLDERS